MKKHKLEIAALTLLLGVLCYAFYDYNTESYDNNIEVSEQKIVLNSDFLTLRENINKNDINLEMLALYMEEKEAEPEEVEEPVEETVEEPAVEEVVESTEVYNYTPPVYYEPAYNGDLASEIINYALQFVGNPYVYGGNSLTEGTDCSGFTKLVFANFGIDLPRVASDQQYAGYWVSLDDLKPGDIVLSGYDGQICHSSLYIGNNQLVHALNASTGIVVTDLYIMPIIQVRRVIN